MGPERYRLNITGIVQGVGFRPFACNLARFLFLNGWVTNTGSGVQMEVEGPREKLDAFMSRLVQEAPALALIRNIDVEHLPVVGYNDFRIEKSMSDNNANTLISPDVSICNDCRNELFSPGDHRYLYPFINCTNCGPRFTIIRDVPYDRPNTTMDRFQMCETCRSQYEAPTDRRYHAQPIACPKCGPKLLFLDRKGSMVCAGDVVKKAGNMLADGYILAIKGLGGYHLACDADNGSAVAELRIRKHRYEKPFAIMAKDLDTVSKYCLVNNEEAALLESVRKPIVLLKKRHDCQLPDQVAPGNPYLGVMLPYTPLHYLLFGNKNIYTSRCPDALVMTSGNRSDEPICYKDSDALNQLNGIADFFLTYDREIYIRTDDSVTRIFKGKEFMIRRARGYAPVPVICESFTSIHSGTPINGRLPAVLACGGELKNTFCLNKEQEFYVSHHIGDLENLETLQSYEEGIEHYKRLFGITPELVAYDLHPGYLSTKYAMASDVAGKVGIQHHKAHIASCMADNNVTGSVIGVAFDGTGYGEDGNIWGGEFFTGSFGNLKRAGHLKYVRMPGGDAAVKEPWRMAAGYLYSAGMDLQYLVNNSAAGGMESIVKGDYAIKLQTVCNMLEGGFNSPFSSSVGRLFDAVSALAGIRYFTSFEGQAAMELEYAADNGNGVYSYKVDTSEGLFIQDMSDMIAGVVDDRLKGISAGAISAKFHETVATMVNDICVRIRKDNGINLVALSGGVFQNILLLTKCMEKLKNDSFNVIIHGRVPANDGGLSLGQAVIAMAEWQAF